MIANGLHLNVCSIDRFDDALTLAKDQNEFRTLIKKNSLPYMLVLLNNALANKKNGVPEKSFEEFLGVISTIKDHDIRKEFMRAISDRVEPQ